MDKEQRMIFLFGLPTIRGEIMEDIYIDYYMGNSNGPSDFGFWLDGELSDEELDSLVKSNRKDQTVMEYYRRYLNHQIDWDSPDMDKLHNLETVEQMAEYLNSRSGTMRTRFALEKKVNGGFTMMDHWALHPEELSEFLRPAMEQIERGETISSDDAIRRIRERIEKEVFNDDERDS